MLSTFSFQPKKSLPPPSPLPSHHFTSSSSPLPFNSSSSLPFNSSLSSLTKTVGLGALCLSLSRSPLLFHRSPLFLSHLTKTSTTTHFFSSTKSISSSLFSPSRSLSHSFSSFLSKPHSLSFLRSSFPSLPLSLKRTLPTLPFLFSASPAFLQPLPPPTTTTTTITTITTNNNNNNKVNALVERVWKRARWLNRMGAFFVDSLLFVLWMIVFARPPFLLFSGVLISIRDCVTSNGSLGKHLAGIHLVTSDGAPAPWYLRLARGVSLFLMQLSVVGMMADGVALLARGRRVTDSLLGLEVVESAYVIEYNDKEE